MIDPALPHIDLHRHLDGNVRLGTILELGAQHGIALPGTTIETLRPHVQVTGVMPDLVAWLDKLHWMTIVLADLDACRRVARENVEDALRDGLDYVELRFSPLFMARPNGLDPAAVVEAVIAGIDEGRAATGLRVKLIGILSRTFGPAACTVELEALLAHRLFDAQTGNWLALKDQRRADCLWCGTDHRSRFGRGEDADLPVRYFAAQEPVRSTSLLRRMRTWVAR